MPVLPPGGFTPGALSNPGGTTSWKTLDIIRFAMQELGAIDIEENPTASEANTGLAKLNRMIDSWNADSRYIYTNNFFVGTLTPNLQPHLVGPQGTATFVMNQRPVKIESANILLNYPGPTTVRSKVNVHQDKGAWWDAQLAPQIASVLPTDMYYQPDWPNGSMFLWVVPEVAYPLELLIWSVLGQLQMDDSFSLPPGYLDAIVYSLAEALAPAFEKPFTADLRILQGRALKRIEGPNMGAPQLKTRDAGLPGAHAGTRSTYNYRTKQNNS